MFIVYNEYRQKTDYGASNEVWSYCGLEGADYLYQLSEIRRYRADKKIGGKDGIRSVNTEKADVNTPINMSESSRQKIRTGIAPGC